MNNKRIFSKLIFAGSAIVISSFLWACSSNYASSDNALESKMAYDGGGYFGVSAPEETYSPDSYAVDFYDEEVTYTTNDAGYGSVGSEGGLTEDQSIASVAQNRKLIKSVDLTIETVNFDQTIAGLRDKIDSVGGYVENEYSFNGSIYNNVKQNKYATVKVRVPEDALDAFLNDVSGIGNVTQKTTSTTDVTLNYVDTESKKEMYIAQKESLQALLEKAESIEDVTYLTQELTRIRYDIESMESTLRVYDDLVDYATVTFTINEVSVLTPNVIEEKTPAQELKEGFKKSFNDVIIGTRDFFIKLVINLPYIIRTLICLAIPALIIFIVIKIIIHNVKKKAKNKANESITEDKGKKEN